MTARNCIIIPVHPPKSNWLVSFLTSLQLRRTAVPPGPGAGDRFRTVLVASNFGDLVFFQRLLSALKLDQDVEWLCVDAYIIDTMKSGTLLQRFQENHDGCVVNLKKLIALQWAAKKGFDWALCIDSDTIVVDDPTDLFDLQIENYRKSRYFGAAGQAGLFSEINSAVAAAFPHEDRARLDQKIPDASWYMWFFDPPFYNLADFQKFMIDMSRSFPSVEDWLSTLNRYTFDHLLFSYWRIAHEGCVPIDYRSLGIDRLPENLTTHDILRISDAYEYRPVWISTVQMFLEPASLNLLPDLRMAYHFDRMYATSG